MKKKGVPERNDSLDALRGIAILLMVLSGSIAFGGVLPSWMYHAQVPPPLHRFDPNIPGITWVDLVFPFFLFSMGAAIPLALRKLEDRPAATANVWWIAIRRYLLLTWFALFTQHMKAWVISAEPSGVHYLLSIVAFALLFVELYQPAHDGKSKLFIYLRILAYALSALLLYLLPFHAGKGFQFDKSDIILLVLANMAFFGTLAWWYTRHNLLLRLGLLPIIMAILLGGKVAGSWNEAVLNWSPLPWMYKFYYLKYLFIIIPGTIAGEMMLGKDNEGVTEGQQHAAGWLAFFLTIVNVGSLFGRHLLPNLFVSFVCIALLLFLIRNKKGSLTYGLLAWGSYLLLLGLCFEAFEGGIKKDSSTFSYYFVTTGLAFYILQFFYTLQRYGIGALISRYLATNGRNPMVAYVAGGLLLTPVLHLTRTQPFFDQMQGNAFTGFMKGFLFTAIVSMITYTFTRQKWYWKT
ncbi:MAG TPA: DUF5009 domain-containing protein [Phnomibacter sp.]|nr:DUF5009 domain-containing protein [Phnomibacter sp.]